MRSKPKSVRSRPTEIRIRHRHVVEQQHVFFEQTLYLRAGVPQPRVPGGFHVVHPTAERHELRVLFTRVHRRVLPLATQRDYFVEVLLGPHQAIVNVFGHLVDGANGFSYRHWRALVVAVCRPTGRIVHLICTNKIFISARRRMDRSSGLKPFESRRDIFRKRRKRSRLTYRVPSDKLLRFANTIIDVFDFVNDQL